MINKKILLLAAAVLVPFGAASYLIFRLARQQPDAFLAVMITAILAIAFFILNVVVTPTRIDFEKIKAALSGISEKLVTTETRITSSNSLAESAHELLLSIEAIERDELARLDNLGLPPIQR